KPSFEVFRWMEQVQSRNILRGGRRHVEDRSGALELQLAQAGAHVGYELRAALAGLFYDQQVFDAAQVLALERRSRAFIAGKSQRGDAMVPEGPAIGFTFDKDKPLRSAREFQKPETVRDQRFAPRPSEFDQTGAFFRFGQREIEPPLDQHHVTLLIEIRDLDAGFERQIAQSERGEEADRESARLGQRRKRYARGRLREIYRLGLTRAAGAAASALRARTATLTGFDRRHDVRVGAARKTMKQHATILSHANRERRIAVIVRRAERNTSRADFAHTIEHAERCGCAVS